MSILKLVPSPHLDLVPEVYNLDLNADTTLVLFPDSYKPPTVQLSSISNPIEGRGLIQNRDGEYIDLESRATWNRVFSDNPNIWDFILTPGDYTHWGICQLTTSTTPTGVSTIEGRQRRRTVQILPTTKTVLGSTSTLLRSVNTNSPATDSKSCAEIPHIVHPVQRPFYQAKIANIILPYQGKRDGNGAVVNQWIIHGLSSFGYAPSERNSRQSDNGWLLGSADEIVLDMCLIEDRIGGFGVRIFGNHNTVQRCVIRNLDKRRSDTVGVMVNPFVRKEGDDDPGKPFPVTGNKILDNEIYNMSDCIGANTVAGHESVNVGSTLVDGNDLYNELQYHDFSDNLIDIKTGSDLSDDGCQITNNRIWSHGLGQQPSDMRANAGDDMIVIHEYARNWLFEFNIIGEGIECIREQIWPSKT